MAQLIILTEPGSGVVGLARVPVSPATRIFFGVVETVNQSASPEYFNPLPTEDIFIRVRAANRLSAEEITQLEFAINTKEIGDTVRFGDVSAVGLPGAEVIVSSERLNLLRQNSPATDPGPLRPASIIAVYVDP